MNFLDHLEVLRRKVLVVVGIFLLLMILFLLFNEILLELFLAPIKGIPIKLVSLRPPEKFMAYLKAAGYGATLLSLPVLLLQVGSFVYPALRGRERPAFIGLMGSMLLLFLGGSYFAYRFLVPFMCAFFYSFYPADGIEPYWSVEGYVDLVFLVILLIAGVFQTPLLLLFLVKVGILSLETLRRYRRHVIVGIFLLAAIITPPDVFSQVLVGGVLYVLYEATLLVGKWIIRSGGTYG